jgi:hypothetical protein
MAVQIAHATQALGVDSGNGEIGKAQWNEAHSVTQTEPGLIGRSTTGAGVSQEITPGTGLTLADNQLSVNYREDTSTLTGTTPSLSIQGGTMKTWTLTGNSAPTDGLQNGDSLTLMIANSSSFTVTWPTIKWLNQKEPTPVPAGYSVIELWKMADLLCGAAAGSVV